MKRYFLLLLVAACTPMEWVRPGAGPEQVRLDATDCQQRAWQEAQFRSFAYGRPRSGLWRDPFWSDNTSFEETRLARFCMESRGYRLERR